MTKIKDLKEIKKLLLGVFAVLVLCICVDLLIGGAFEKAYKHSKYGIFNRQIYCLEKSNDEILILGSSRAAHHYVPKIFTDSLGMSCYNAGSDGMCIYYHYAILSSYIARGDKPKLVILDVVPTDVQVSNTATFSLDAALERLAPHYGEYSTIDSLFELNGWKEKLKIKSKLYRYNSKLVQLIKCKFIPSPENRGYEAIFGELPIDAVLGKDSYNDDSLEPQKVKYFQKLIDLTKKNNVTLLIVQSPKFSNSLSLGIDTIRNLAAKNDIPFIDKINAPEFMNVHYMKDKDHLNDAGAHKYSQLMSQIIRETID